VSRAPNPTRTRTAILISGGGSNMAALIQAASDPAYPADIALVLSNVPDAGGLARAEAAGVPTVLIDHRPFGKDRAAFDAAVHATLTENDIAFVALAGFMRILTPGFVALWSGRMINIHPSLLPLYKGLHTHQRALEAGDSEAGCTVHWVTPELDAGGSIAQARVPIMPGDTAETLAARVLVAEHRLYPGALAEAVRTARQTGR
jgi:formyltetrahydrofolate-dependent phosphoribosylglycinamide formyltransferase